MALSDADADSLIIVGAAGCGMMAALVAAGKGISVLLLEKTDKPGGSTAFSSRGIRAGGSGSNEPWTSNTVRSSMLETS
ncbi:MAG: FAD-dependent oxidoreductase [Dehalococcoidia bacterium]